MNTWCGISSARLQTPCRAATPSLLLQAHAYTTATPQASLRYVAYLECAGSAPSIMQQHADSSAQPKAAGEATRLWTRKELALGKAMDGGCFGEAVKASARSRDRIP